MSPQYITVTELAYQLNADLEPLMEMLSPSDQRIVNKFCDYILQQRVANANVTNLLPLEVALFLIQLEEHKHNHHEVTELHNQLQEIRGENTELRNLLQELKDEIERLKTAT
jgi:hypothetical protein